MQRPIIQSEVDPKCALETLCELLPYGFGDAEFERVHHWGARGKLNRFKNYCQGLNVVYRVLTIQEHWDGFARIVRVKYFF